MDKAFMWVVFALIIMFWGWRESVEHVACIESGGDVSLGWFQDGCVVRK